MRSLGLRRFGLGHRMGDMTDTVPENAYCYSCYLHLNNFHHNLQVLFEVMVQEQRECLHCLGTQLESIPMCEFFDEN